MNRVLSQEDLDALLSEEPVEAAATTPPPMEPGLEGILSLEDRGIQLLLHESQRLAIALKNATPEIQAAVIRNLPKTAGELLRGDIESPGPVMISDVQAAQRAIVKKAKALLAQGKIQLKTGSAPSPFGPPESSDHPSPVAPPELLEEAKGLEKLEARDFQLLIRELGRDNLLLALRVSPDSFREKIFQNVSAGARSAFQDDLRAVPALQQAEPWRALEKVIQLARRLRAEGKFARGTP